MQSERKHEEEESLPIVLRKGLCPCVFLCFFCLKALIATTEKGNASTSISLPVHVKREVVEEPAQTGVLSFEEYKEKNKRKQQRKEKERGDKRVKFEGDGDERAEEPPAGGGENEKDLKKDAKAFLFKECCRTLKSHVEKGGNFASLVCFSSFFVLISFLIEECRFFVEVKERKVQRYCIKVHRDDV